MAEQKKKLQTDDDYSLQEVPASARKGFWSMFVVMMGFTFFSASMSVGAKLGNGLDLSTFLWAVVIGGVILGAYTGALAYVGCDTGLTLDLLAQAAGGHKRGLVVGMEDKACNALLSLGEAAHIFLDQR